MRLGTNCVGICYGFRTSWRPPIGQEISSPPAPRQKTRENIQPFYTVRLLVGVTLIPNTFQSDQCCVLYLVSYGEYLFGFQPEPVRLLCQNMETSHTMLYVPMSTSLLATNHSMFWSNICLLQSVVSSPHPVGRYLQATSRRDFPHSSRLQATGCPTFLHPSRLHGLVAWLSQESTNYPPP